VSELLGVLTPAGWASLAGLAVLVLALTLVLVRRRSAVTPLRRLLGPLGQPPVVTVFLRGLFVPNHEFFARAPEDPRNPAAGVTVHKWGPIPEVHSASDVQALSRVLGLLVRAFPGVQPALLTGDPGRQAWNTPAIALGPHFRALQILDSCEPRLVALRQPPAFRSLVTPDLFEAKDGAEYGLIYKGRHGATHHPFLVLLGLADPGTDAAARFLEVHATSLGRLTGGRPFAAVVSRDPARPSDIPRLRSLQPRPAWWRRLVYRRRWRELSPAPPTRKS